MFATECLKGIFDCFVVLGFLQLFVIILRLDK